MSEEQSLFVRPAEGARILPLTGDRTPTALLRTPFTESHGQISPDGKWLAYQSNETGRYEVYVQPAPSRAGRWPVSTNGGHFPRWRRDGRELFYMSQSSGGKLVAVDVKANGATFEAGTPLDLFDTGSVNQFVERYNTYAVSLDGQRFLIPRPEATAAADTISPIVVVLNWADGIRK